LFSGLNVQFSYQLIIPAAASFAIYSFAKVLLMSEKVICVQSGFVIVTFPSQSTTTSTSHGKLIPPLPSLPVEVVPVELDQVEVEVVHVLVEGIIIDQPPQPQPPQLELVYATNSEALQV
jgi:hypothetical protein